MGGVMLLTNFLKASLIPLVPTYTTIITRHFPSETLSLDVSTVLRIVQAFGHAVPLFGHLAHDLSAISGIGSGVDPDFGLIDRRRD